MRYNTPQLWAAGGRLQAAGFGYMIKGDGKGGCTIECWPHGKGKQTTICTTITAVNQLIKRVKKGA